MRKLLIIFVYFFTLIKCFDSYANNKFSTYLKNTDANVIFLRHTLAPGYGDPTNFNIDDCKTQRNLNDLGRKQAKNLGIFFKLNNINFTEILTSEWCRCIQTAENLNSGKWKTFSGLNSFFESYSDKNKVLKKLRSKLKKINEKDLILMITHQVVISEITGIYTQSGGIVFYNTVTRKSKGMFIN